MTAGLCQGSLALAAIDMQGIELTSRSAAWRLDAGRSAEREVAIARWWAADAGKRIVHVASRDREGVGVDRDHPCIGTSLWPVSSHSPSVPPNGQLATLGACVKSFK